MLRETAFCIPFYKDLKKEAGWTPHPSKDHEFHAIRLHAFARFAGGGEEFFDGNPVKEITADEGVRRRLTTTVSVEVELVQQKELVRELIATESATENLVRGIDVALGPKRARLSASLRDSLKKEFIDSFRRGNATRSERALRTITSTSDELEIPTETGDRYYVVQSYRKQTFDVYISCIDYLTIAYEGSSPILRKRRNKLPPPGDHPNRRRRNSWRQNGPNVIEFNVPVRSITYWEAVPGSFSVKRATNYASKVPDPNVVTVEDVPSERRTSHTLPIDDGCPSLYSLSNQAFLEKLPLIARSHSRDEL